MTKCKNIVSRIPGFLTVAWKGSKYFVIGRCLSGSRHYSESVFWDDIAELFDKYVAVVDYFGGGIVEVYCEDGTLLASEVVTNFDF
jgi:hypothetical protein